MTITAVSKLFHCLVTLFKPTISPEYQLGKLVKQQTSPLTKITYQTENIQNATIVALTDLAEDNDSQSYRLQRYILALALELKKHPRFSHFLTDENIELLFKLAPLHDIGAIAIPKDVLGKKGEFSTEERETIKQHAILGEQALKTAEQEIGEHGRFLNIARQMTSSHHERWDGSGYPFGLSQEEIPIPARLMALVDVFDALIHERSYKPALAPQQAIEIICQERNKQFDPAIVDAFLSIKEQFVEIANSFKDQPRMA